MTTKEDQDALEELWALVREIGEVSARLDRAADRAIEALEVRPEGEGTDE